MSLRFENTLYIFQIHCIGVPVALSDAVYSDMTRARRLLEESSIDAIVVAWPENVGYVSGFYHPDLHLTWERLHVVVWASGHEPVFVVPRPREQNWMANTSQPWGPDDQRPHIDDIRGFDGEHAAAMHVIGDALEEHGITAGTVGVEFRSAPYRIVRGLQKRFPKLTFADAWPLLNEMRKIKTAAEVELITSINQLTAQAMGKVLSTVEPGETERSVASRLTHTLLDAGADELSHTVFGGDCRGGQWHPWPSERLLEKGDVLRADWGIRKNGYRSDIARTTVVGTANAHQRDHFSRILEVFDIVVDSVCPGVVASEIFQLAKKNYERLGLEFRWPIVGHGIGLVLHEEPHLTPEYDDPIVEGMLLEIELGWVDENVGYHYEDLVHVGPSGATCLTGQPGTWRLIESGTR
ncbi:M24 family metallopeptidase [Saccharopolyspora phatthalungensis]|uniref:Xaa-Pro aminopeptidase n=1 Tax=Saccharopolyspora phatthalungensis TaxID=664693 RepID=A0A840QKY5_9PSEU|nr:Xaa-Pro peptidase family protein [Saccharopolyspora phatthalungensis]MBB5159863.1 Xaa-Pro aminopeptidase [Saccharopolyspora phatthalungensis]